MPEIVPARREDCDRLYPELVAHHAYGVLVDSFAESSSCFVIRDGSLPLALYGVVPHPLDPTLGGTWMAVGRGLRNHRVWFYRRAAEIAGRVEGGFAQLLCRVETGPADLSTWVERAGYVLTHQTETQKTYRKIVR
ncbi:hypothetical protein [Telmatospirillum sp. J64-1]|uniref:hypothetical protein n=1 Tax=Telmatospirillum sp. J64-1 TaxID=2502183 RepID=UPI00115E9FA3|nr:hypothetical protein [Telmatospirillum sp. J64-1]